MDWTTNATFTNFIYTLLAGRGGGYGMAMRTARYYDLCSSGLVLHLILEECPCRIIVLYVTCRIRKVASGIFLGFIEP